VGIGARFGYGTDTWDHDFAFAYNYGEDEGDETTNRFLGSYDASRYFTDRLYGFGDLRYTYDEYGAYEQDLFVGVGLGYHVIDTADTAWRVQAGPGYRRLVNYDGSTEDEAAASLSSKLWWSLSDTAVLTNDTDVIYSDSDTLIANDLGVNVALSDALSMRTSLRTEYHTDPLPGREDTDHTLGVSLIYSFR
jgi:putative salt-induced outer membrane protein